MEVLKRNDFGAKVISWRRWPVKFMLMALMVGNLLLWWKRPRKCASIKTCPQEIHPQNTCPGIAPLKSDTTTRQTDGVWPVLPPRSLPVQRIPKIVHFVFGLAPNYGAVPFSLINYLIVKAAYKHIKPEAIILHHIHLPESVWFKRVADKYLTLSPVKPITEIYGNPVAHYAHQADIVRLHALQRYGGIYMDMDLMMLRPLDPLLYNEMLMAQEGEGGRIGLCNALIMAEKNAPFVKRWLESYRTFNGSEWNYHSVILPGLMARQHPEEITILGHTRFFWPMWDDGALRELFRGTSWDFRDNFGIHLWESKSHRKYLKGLTVRKILQGTSTFDRILQSLIWDEVNELLELEKWSIE